jgi:hypothetical protein
MIIKIHNAEAIPISREQLDKVKSIRTIPPKSKRTFHGFLGVMIRQDYKGENCWRAKLNYNGKTLHLGQYSDPFSPQIVVEIVKEELKYV